MTEVEWLACEEPERILNFLRGSAFRNSLPERKSRLFGLVCCNRVRQLLIDPRTRRALDVLEQYTEGQVASEDLRDAYDDAFRAANEIEETEGTRGAAQAAFAVAEACYEKEIADAYSGRVRFVVFFDEARDEAPAQVALIRDIFGNPFAPVAFDPAWRTDTAVAVARQMYDSREFGAMPILADALQDAGCDDEQVLAHCRDASQVHVRGCWVCDLVLGKE